ncbi:MAG: flagellar hook-associated protein FlgK [Acidobacteria bacterium]|nr:flagellar hook-associated protein FlgK [Acidobacteriota bacterium]
MGTLWGSFYIGLRSLNASQTGLSVTGNNIANVNTPGYSRQHAVLTEALSIRTAVGAMGTGVDVQSVLAIRDRFLEYRLVQQGPQQGREETLSAALSAVEAVFNETQTSGIQSAMSAFFSAYSALASQPENMSLRTDVLTKAQQMAALFRSHSAALEEVQLGSDRAVSSIVSDINALTAQIADLNQEVVQMESGSIPSANDLRDQRDELVRQLSKMVNIAVTETENGAVTISAGSGRLLVAGNRSYDLTAVAQPPSGFKNIFSGTTDITAEITGGTLAGNILARDTYVPAYLSQLDTLAAQVGSDVNALHTTGYGMNNLTGFDFFVPWVGPVTGAAAAFDVDPAIVADVNRIATGSAINQPGNNDIATQMADLATALNMSGGTASYSNYYANLTFNVGEDLSRATDNLEIESAILTQLQNQRDAVSAVSLDEEAAAMIQFQRQYQAGAQFLRVIDDLTEFVINTFGS